MCTGCELLYVYRVQAVICVQGAICYMSKGYKLIYGYRVQVAICVQGASCKCVQGASCYIC